MVFGGKNLPNILTVSRIFAVLIFVAIASVAHIDVISDKSWVFALRISAVILAMLAGLTDLLDGYLARKYHWVSDFGALMDPLADKIFVTGTMLMAVEFRIIPAWIAIAVLFREFMVTGLRTLAAKKQIVISADRWGKLKTALQMTMLGIAGVAWAIDGGNEYLFTESWFGIRIWYIWLTFMTGIVLITLFSGLGYFIRYRKLFLSQE
ncbi:MAG: CDP-diacylglycerol--glycerol-3-phosphate 3-phosphatidyltransferase [Lentisphaeria bacterium]|nr:CDP-diacylglycerol--glycerol-3-phosphate 3-phosphatidyltransferase [Lentisphaerota bacterium]MBR2625166.1 CDP-diacylglycerol--glycerol-3-phosphate 3-phosphatidyltransferase [Lentisphaeria bacterium]